MSKFKIEAEGGRFDVYKSRTTGKYTIRKGEASIRGTLVSRNMPVDEALNIQRFEDLAAAQASLLKAA